MEEIQQPFSSLMQTLTFNRGETFVSTFWLGESPLGLEERYSRYNHNPSQ